jgi:hypothetical protein
VRQSPTLRIITLLYHILGAFVKGVEANRGGFLRSDSGYLRRFCPDSPLHVSLPAGVKNGGGERLPFFCEAWFGERTYTNRVSRVHALPPSVRFPPLREGNRAGFGSPCGQGEPAGGGERSLISALPHEAHALGYELFALVAQARLGKGNPLFLGGEEEMLA